jgi:hypothetical protein
METSELARAWMTDLGSVEGLDRCDRHVGPQCLIHVDGTTIDWPSLRCLVIAYDAVFPSEAFQVANVATWQDKAMITFSVQRATPWTVGPAGQRTAFLRLLDGRIVEVWLIDDWAAWMARHGLL